MRKMPCLFVRKFHDDRSFTLTPEVTPGCEWVVAGEGVATVKWDGTACLVKDAELWKRYDAKVNPRSRRRKDPPPGSIPCDPEPDPVTGHWPHWVRVDPGKPEDRWHVEAWDKFDREVSDVWILHDERTYELIGPAINGNPQGLDEHMLMVHLPRDRGLEVSDRSFPALQEFLRSFPYEGVVFHHPDGRMCKIRRRDFGFPWPPRRT